MSAHLWMMRPGKSRKEIRTKHRNLDLVRPKGLQPVLAERDGTAAPRKVIGREVTGLCKADLEQRALVRLKYQAWRDLRAMQESNCTGVGKRAGTDACEG